MQFKLLLRFQVINHLNVLASMRLSSLLSSIVVVYKFVKTVGDLTQLLGYYPVEADVGVLCLTFFSDAMAY
ncbi:hypothetical protein [Oceanicoccus sp. KOV_DT_Chl]|uniref:hypothetical protein n=1 Tax=Oceanicoccus sp. KOV_DT_Chl TaxID=1904639 RepID=UPI000C7C1B64|nr:hypothetical protein [Oceanicoccus sp. KOV_DT_Chl]